MTIHFRLPFMVQGIATSAFGAATLLDVLAREAGVESGFPQNPARL